MKTVAAKQLPRLLTALLLAAVFACGRGEDKTAIIVARAGARAITLKDFEDALARIVPPGSPDGRDDMAAVKRNLIHQMVEETLILDEAGRMGITVSDDELSAEVEVIKKESGGETFKDAITERYGDISVWKEEIRKKLIIKKTVAKVTATMKPPSVDDARKYYEKHIEDFDVPEQAHARMIVVSSEDDARKIRRTLTPENFAKTAKESSLSPEGKNGGDLGFFGRGDMPKEFEDAVFRLSPGEISPVVKTDYGYHIFYVEARHKGGRLKLEEVRSKIIERLRLEEADIAFGKWLNGLKERGNIEINEALL